MKKPRLNKSEKALIELNGRIISAIKAYRDRTGASLQEAKLEVERFRDNPEAYEAEENDQEQRRRDLERYVHEIILEVEVLEHLDAPILMSTNKSRSDILTMQYNKQIFINHLAYILAPVFGVYFDENIAEEDN